MKKAVFYIFIGLLPGHFVSAQNPNTISCRIGANTLQAKTIEGYGLAFLYTDSLKQQIDTLLISQLGGASTECKCSDTMAVFYTRGPFQSRLSVFSYKNEKWMFFYDQTLPGENLHTGILIPGKKYAVCSHRLLEPTVLLANKKVIVSDVNGKVSQVEKSEVRYKIDVDNRRLILESEIIVEE